MYKTYNEAVIKFIEDYDIKPAEIARQLGITRANLTQWKNNTSKISADKIVLMIDIYPEFLKYIADMYSMKLNKTDEFREKYYQQLEESYQMLKEKYEPYGEKKSTSQKSDKQTS